jgi:hypothetical protein
MGREVASTLNDLVEGDVEGLGELDVAQRGGLTPRRLGHQQGACPPLGGRVVVGTLGAQLVACVHGHGQHEPAPRMIVLELGDAGREHDLLSVDAGDQTALIGDGLHALQRRDAAAIRPPRSRTARRASRRWRSIERTLRPVAAAISE